MNVFDLFLKYLDILHVFVEVCKTEPFTCLHEAPCTVKSDLTVNPKFECDCSQAKGGSWTGPRCEVSTGGLLI